MVGFIAHLAHLRQMTRRHHQAIVVRSMRTILETTLGSYGNFYPMLSLALRLKEARRGGHLAHQSLFGEARPEL